MRLTWCPHDWDHDSTMQWTVRGSGAKTTIRFHQEWLAGPEERERQRAHWRQVMSDLVHSIPHH